MAKVMMSAMVWIPQNEKVARKVVEMFRDQEYDRVPYLLDGVETSGLEGDVRFLSDGSRYGIASVVSAFTGKGEDVWFGLHIVHRHFMDQAWADLELDLPGLLRRNSRASKRQRDWLPGGGMVSKSHYVEDDGRNYLALHPRDRGILPREGCSQVDFDEWMDYYAFVLEMDCEEDDDDWQTPVSRDTSDW